MQSSLTIGCDPELVCRRNGSFIAASHSAQPKTEPGDTYDLFG
jgi:hypothetical protein